MTINQLHTYDREIVSEDGIILKHSEQMILAYKVIDMLANGEIELIEGDKITAGTISIG